MPKTLADNIGSFPDQTAPLAADARTAGSVETPFQNSADRTRWARDRIILVDPVGEGVRKLRYTASITSLKAITDLTDNAVIIVDGVGLFIYDANSSLTAVDPFIVAPTSVGGGAGRWIWEAYGSLDVANGMARLNANGRLPIEKSEASGGTSKILASNVGYGLVDFVTSTDAGPRTQVGTSYTDAGTIAIATTLAINDRVFLIGQAYGYQVDLTLSYHWTRLAVTKPDTSVAQVGLSEAATKTSSLNEYIPRPLSGIYVATAAGTHTFRIQQRADAGAAGGTFSLINLALTALVFRP